MSKVLDHSFYNPARGGHAPGDIRAAFIDALDAFEAWCDHEPAPLVDVRGQSLALGTVCGVTVHLPLRRVRPIDSPMISKELAWRNGLPRGGICDSLGAWDAKTNLT